MTRRSESTRLRVRRGRFPSATGLGLAAWSVCVALLPSCEKLMAGLVAPSPGDFVQALRAKQAQVDAARWTPIVGTTALFKNPRKAFARCQGKADTALLNCLALASRTDNVALPLVEACEQGNGLYAERMSCVDFVGGLTPTPHAETACARAFGYDWAACVLRHAPRRALAPVRALLLHDIQAFARLEEARTSPPLLATTLPIDPKPALPWEARSNVDALAPVESRLDDRPETGDAEDGDVGVDLGDDTRAQARRPDTLAPIDEDGFLKACRAALSPATHGEVALVCDDLAPEAKRGAFTAEAVKLCLLAQGEPRNPMHSADCLMRVRGRFQTASGLAACTQAFDKTHAGYLFFVKACAARSGHPRFDTASLTALELALRDATQAGGSSRAAALERYEDLASRLRDETPLSPVSEVP